LGGYRKKLCLCKICVFFSCACARNAHECARHNETAMDHKEIGKNQEEPVEMDLGGEKKRVSIALDRDIWEKGRALASQQHRSFSGMISVLIKEEGGRIR